MRQFAASLLPPQKQSMVRAGASGGRGMKGPVTRGLNEREGGLQEEEVKGKGMEEERAKGEGEEDTGDEHDFATDLKEYDCEYCGRFSGRYAIVAEHEKHCAYRWSASGD